MAPPRKLLSLGHSYVVTLNRRLAHEMSRAGNGDWEVTAAAPTYFHGGNDLGPLSLEVQKDEPCPVVGLPAYFSRRVHIFLYGLKLRSLLAQGWDLVHAWEEPYILAGGQVAYLTPRGTPLVFRTAQSISKSFPPPFCWVERYAMKRAAGWICSGQTVASALRDRPGYAGLPMALIPLGVDMNEFRPDPEAGAAVRRSLGWTADGPPVVGFLGRLVAEKGITFLTQVLDRVQAPWRALIVGVGRLEPELRRWAANQGDRARICTDVRHAQAPRYLNAMDVLCAPSLTLPNWREQFGRMVVEAFASGVPVLSSNSGELPHVVAGAGIAVPEADADGWVRTLTELLEQPERRSTLAGQGLAKAREQYAWPLVARRYLDFFDRVVAQPADGSSKLLSRP
jgi:glycosyltransferase involved in cell wall biosynthesis